MNFDYTPKVQALREKLLAFFDAHIYPNERAYAEEIAANRAAGNAWIPTRLIEGLKEQARAEGILRITLLTDMQNERAQAMYRRVGFVGSPMKPMRLKIKPR